jgi:hypothetical protein
VKQTTNDGFTKEDLEAIRVLQKTENLTPAAAKKRFRKIQEEKLEGDSTVDHVGPPITGKRQAAKNKRLQQRQEFLDAANNSAKIVAANFREALPHYVKFETLVRQTEAHFTCLQDFFKKHKRDGSELLLNKYNSLKHYLKDECDGISERQYHRVINSIKHPLLEEDNGHGGKKQPKPPKPPTPKLEAKPSTAEEKDILNGEVDGDDSGEETPVIPQTPSLPALPAPQEEGKPADKKPDRETQLKRQLQLANLAAIDAEDELTDTSQLAFQQRELLDKIVSRSQKHGNLIQPEDFRLFLLQDLPRQLRAFDDNYGKVDNCFKAKSAAA